MKKIKEIWRHNRVLFVLFVILVICFTAIVTVSLTYFVGAENNPYGNRLENKVKLPKDFSKDIAETLKEDENVENASVRLAVRTIYINIEYAELVTLEDAKVIAENSLELIDNKILEYYDLNYIISKKDSENDIGFTLMGARNSYGTGFVWNNNNLPEEEKE